MVSLLRRDAAGETFRRVEAMLEFPMVVMSLLFIPVIVGPLVADLSSRSETQLLITGLVLWLAFVIEFVWLL